MKNINNTKQKNEAPSFQCETKRCFAIVLMLLVFSLFGKVNAQIPTWQWAKGIGGNGDDGGVLTLDASGNIYMAGSFHGTVDFNPGVGVFNLTSAGGYDIFISKSDSSGNFLWAKRIGGTSNDYGSTIQLDNLGNIYIGGAIDGTVDFDPGAGVFNLVPTSSRLWYISKYDNNGNFIWVTAHGGGNDLRENIAFDASGNVYAGGYFFGTIDFDPGPGVFNLSSAGGVDAFAFKLSSSGNFLWAFSWGGTASDHGHSIASDVSGNTYITGSFSGAIDFNPGPAVFNLTSKGGEDIYVLKINSSGNFIWAKAMGGTNTERPHDISIDPFGNVVTTGFFTGTVDFDPGVTNYNLTSTTGWDCFISKLDSSGNFVWAKSNEGGIWFQPYYSDFDAVGNVYTFGNFEGTVDLDPGPGIFNVTSKGDYDCFITKLDVAGNFIWGKEIGGAGRDYNGLLVCDYAGNVFISLVSPTSVTFDAITLANHGAYDIFIAKIAAPTVIDCSTITCSINPQATPHKVAGAGCNNGKIRVDLCGTFQFYPRVELYNSSDVMIQSADLPLGTLVYKFENLTVGDYTVKVYDGTCCEHDLSVKIKCYTPFACLNATNITANSAQLNWCTIICAVGYKVQYREQGTTDWTTKGLSTNIGMINLTGLQPLTTYEWRVASKCQGWPDFNLFNYSNTKSFTTALLRMGDAGHEIQGNESIEINMYPNPATYTLTVNFETENATALLKVVNTVGQVVYEKQLNSDEGSYEEQLDVSKLNTGVYMLLVKTGQGVSMKKFAKE